MTTSEETDPPSTAAADEAEWWDGGKARVFVSCGQRGTSERQTARRIRTLVGALGFCPYLAFEAHSSKSLTEGIYGHLRTAEYFLFVDFARESLDGGPTRRGSLFSNQELAIASFLELDSLFFVESLAEQRAGILGVVQGNPIEFPQGTDPIPVIECGIREALWQPIQRRGLHVGRSPGQRGDALLGGADPARYFELQLRNLHHRTFATGCMVRVLEIRDLTNDVVRVPDLVEMKFKHITWPVVSLAPQSMREFDGMLIRHASPSEAILGVLNIPYVDSGSIVAQHTIYGPGDFEIDIVVYSREFSPARSTLLIHLGQRLDEATLSVRSSPQVVPAGGKVAPS
jgi:hypothetical protein